MLSEKLKMRQKAKLAKPVLKVELLDQIDRACSQQLRQTGIGRRTEDPDLVNEIFIRCSRKR